MHFSFSEFMCGVKRLGMKEPSCIAMISSLHVIKRPLKFPKTILQLVCVAKATSLS